MLGTLSYDYLQYKKNDYNKAIPLLKESSAASANDPTIHYHLGMAYYKSGNTALARKTLVQALQLRQDFPGAQEAREVLAQLK